MGAAPNTDFSLAMMDGAGTAAASAVRATVSGVAVAGFAGAVGASDGGEEDFFLKNENIGRFLVSSAFYETHHDFFICQFFPCCLLAACCACRFRPCSIAACWPLLGACLHWFHWFWPGLGVGLGWLAGDAAACACPSSRADQNADCDRCSRLNCVSTACAGSFSRTAGGPGARW